MLFRSGSPAYNVPLAYQLDGPLDVPVLQRALNLLVARHEPLRTTIHSSEGTPVQSVQPARPVELAVVEAQEDPEELLRREAQRSFDLARDPMLRALLVRLGHHRHVLLLTVHHIATDGWSIGILFRELSEAYSAYAAGREPALAALPVRYADFALWQREWLRGERLEAQVAYWRQQLAGAPALDLPADRPRPARQSTRGAREVVGLSDRKSTRLNSSHIQKSRMPSSA